MADSFIRSSNPEVALRSTDAKLPDVPPWPQRWEVRPEAWPDRRQVGKTLEDPALAAPMVRTHDRAAESGSSLGWPYLSTWHEKSGESRPVS